MPSCASYFAITFACLYVAFMFWSHVTFTGLVPELSTPVTAINTNVEYFMGIIDVNALYTSDRWIVSWDLLCVR